MFPPYWAVRVWLPAVASVRKMVPVEKLGEEPLSAGIPVTGTGLPSCMGPSKKVTVPVGGPPESACVLLYPRRTATRH